MQSNLLKRVITASIIFPLVISIILYQNDLIVRLFLNIVIFLAAFELSRLCFTDNSENRNEFNFEFPARSASNLFTRKISNGIVT